MSKAFEYLEHRLTDHYSIESNYKLSVVYSIFDAMRAFDPWFTKQAGNLTRAFVARMSVLPWLTPPVLAELQKELPAYTAAANASQLDFDHTS